MKGRQISRVGLTACCSFLIVALCSAQKTDEVPSASTPAIRTLESTHFSPYATGTTFAELAKANPKNRDIVQAKTVPSVIANLGASTEKDVWLHVLAANSDVVVIGRPSNPISALVDTGTFVFSDYQFQIETVLMAKHHVLNAGQTIIVSRPGGYLKDGLFTFRGIDPEFHLFREGERYLLFLHRIPETNTFTVGASGSYLLQNGKVLPGATHSRNLPQVRSEDEFMKSAWFFTNQEGARR